MKCHEEELVNHRGKASLSTRMLHVEAAFCSFSDHRCVRYSTEKGNLQRVTWINS